MSNTLRLTLEYEGTRYRGFQEQKNARTVAGELRTAIEAVVGERVELGGAGRTDAGVHALEQSAHLKTKTRLDPKRLVREVNERLPPDIHLTRAVSASARFHARHDARTRSYVYQISRRRTALAKRFVWWVRRPLEIDAMREAAAALGGMHDFARFSEKPEEQTSTRVLVERAEVVGRGELVLVRIAASHFLWKMVRRVVGTLAEIGAGELGADALGELLDPSSRAARRSFDPAAHTAPRSFDPAAHTAPPSGLFLERVIYDGDPPLGELVAPVPVGGGSV